MNPPPLSERSFSADEPVKVSICTIAFNHGAYLKDTLDGFLAQRCDFRVEIIVHDDASTDDTADILRDYAARHPGIIRPIIQTENLFSKGVNPYYAYVFPSATGQYIALCDGDDYWDDPDKLTTQVGFLDTNPDVSVSFGGVHAITDDGVQENYKNGLERDIPVAELKNGPPINTPSAVFKNIFQDGPPPFLRYSPMGDMTVWAMLGHHGRGAYLPDLKPAMYRLHSGGIFSKKGLRTQLFMGTISLMTIAAYHSGQDDQAASRAALRRAIGQIVMLNGGMATVKEAMRKSLSLWSKRLRKKGPSQ
ncbi:MAG: glycosyltransferase [Pseudomonadota bacterium]